MFERDSPFRYQVQYEDSETGLYYNRFRYYSPDEGMYTSQDPIGLQGGMQLYGYVSDTNYWVDTFGLDKIPNKVNGDAREAIALEHLKKQHPNATILKERYIRDVSGKSVRDVITNSRRRVDFVVIENGKVTGVYEVTSPTADKTAQMLKETEIRGNGGTRVKAPGRKGALYDISDIETQRLDVDLETKKVKCH